MPPLRPRTGLDTHRVENQPPERGDVDLWAGDRPLREAAARNGAPAAPLAALGAALGRAETRERGRLASRFPPELAAFDRAGRRLDEVRFHPAYHDLMALGIGAGYAALPWTGVAGGHAAHAAMVYLVSQVEPGVCCPMTMTYAAYPALAPHGEAANWLPRIAAGRYDPASRPAPEKAGVTVGMAMTEKQGGSDVRANATQAEPVGDGWRLTGHKWFCSAPMSDAFLTLAQAPGGLTCFLVPRWTEAGERNRLELVRLKDKLGNRANASAEIEYHGAHALRLGDEGAGVRAILEMVHHTRLDTAMAPAGLMRAALAEALHWCANRDAFGRRLIGQPLMESVLADLALETEAALALGLRVARAFDEGDRAFARIAVALAKFLNTKRCVPAIYEAMECLGGAGYVEEAPLALLYREAPLNSIWEGSGNVICLDVLRTLSREPAARKRLAEVFESVGGRDRRFDAGMAAFTARWPDAVPEGEARFCVERLATLLTAATLLDAEDMPEAVVDAYLSARVVEESGRVTGALPSHIDRRSLIERATPC